MPLVTVDANINGKKLETFNGSIEFRNVGFMYDDAVILKNINLKVEKGKRLHWLAVVAPVKAHWPTLYHVFTT